MERVLCIGHTAYDVTLQVDDYPKENTKVTTGMPVCCSGGAATNASFLLAKWGMEVYLCSLVGEDTYYNRIKQELIEANIHIDYLRTSSHFHTTVSYVIANKQNGSRTIIISKTKKETLKEVSFQEEFTGIIADLEEPEVTLQALKRYKGAISILDAGSFKPSAVTLGREVTYFICSRDFAEQYCGVSLDPTDLDSLSSCYRKLVQEINPNTIITLGEYGSFTSDQGKYYLIPSIQIKALDTTGSGDLYHGAFYYFISQNTSYLTAVRRANITGALAARYVGRKFSIPTLEEVLANDST